jgi:hypothetical protein
LLIIDSDCLLDHPTAEIQAYAPYSTLLYLVSTVSANAEEGIAIREVHSLFSTLNKANLVVEEVQQEHKKNDESIEQC